MRHLVGMAAMALAMMVGEAAADGMPHVYDRDNAVDIMRTCAACHGETGAGGGGGVYPRLAGLNAEYLAKQLGLFKTRARENIPMIPYATERELPERDVLDIARYLSEIRLETKPPADLPKDGFARLEAMKKVLQIPREPGDAETARPIYAAECAPCHGRNGEGRLARPRLAGQHIKYLKVQVENFLAGKRAHDDIEALRAKSQADWTNLWACISILQE